MSIKHIVPAFFVIDGTSADDAESMATSLTIGLNNRQREGETANPSTLKARLFLCEASPVTQWDGSAPTTLEGLTIDSGSDRSAAGLIRTIAGYSGMTPDEALPQILKIADDWLRQRMALHPTAPPIQPAEAKESQSNTDLRLATAERVARAVTGLLLNRIGCTTEARDALAAWREATGAKS